MTGSSKLRRGALSTIDQVSVPSPIAVEKLMDTSNGEGQSSHVLVFCVNFERHICTYITTSIKCYLVSLRYVWSSVEFSCLWSFRATAISSIYHRFMIKYCHILLHFDEKCDFNLF